MRLHDSLQEYKKTLKTDSLSVVVITGCGVVMTTPRDYLIVY